jgi:hypothetical protein
MVDDSLPAVRCRPLAGLSQHPGGPLRGTLYALTILSLTAAILAGVPFFRPLALPVGSRLVVIVAGD